MSIHQQLVPCKGKKENNIRNGYGTLTINTKLM